MSEESAFVSFAQGIVFTALMASVIMHGKGVAGIVSAIEWGLYYREDWEHYASRFTD